MENTESYRENHAKRESWRNYLWQLENVFNPCSTVKGSLSIRACRRLWEGVLCCSCDQSEVSVKRLFYIGTRGLRSVELSETSWIGMNYASSASTPRPCALGGMWAIVPVNREEVFQVGSKENTGWCEWVSIVRDCVYLRLLVCFCACFKTERDRSYSVGGIITEHCFLFSAAPWKAVVTMWDGKYIRYGQQKSWPPFLPNWVTEDQCNAKKLQSDCWYTKRKR